MNRALIPCAITLAGLLLRLYFLARGGWPWALFGILCDMLDGHVARRLNAVSRFGAKLDWYSDVLCAAVALYASGESALVAAPSLVVLWSLQDRLPRPISGSSLLLLSLALKEVIP